MQCNNSTRNLSTQVDIKNDFFTPWPFQEGGIGQNEDGIWDPFTVEDLLAKDIMANLDAVTVISTNASKEYSLEKALDTMRADWNGVEFRVIGYKNTGTYIIGGTDDIQVSLLS